MKVYVVNIKTDLEEDNFVLGIYSTREKAQKAMEDFLLEEDDSSIRGDVEEVEVE